MVIFKVNNAGTTLLGYQTNELLNQPYYSLIYEEDLEEIINTFHRVKRAFYFFRNTGLS